MKNKQEEKIISQFLNSIGSWSNHVIIGGGFALFIYKLYLSDPQLKNFPIGTNDIDSILPRRVPEISKRNLAKHLSEAGFTQVFRDLEVPATEAYLKNIEGVEIEIEFLTDSSTRNDKTKNVVISGVTAQPLSYMALSLKKTIKFQTYSGENGRVVSPGAWVFHKGLTFTKRPDTSKKLKDLYGIWYVMTQLGDFSSEAIQEFKKLTQNQPKWFETWKKNLLSWIGDASPSDWSMLETQDPSGKLKKLNFVKIIKALSAPLS